MDIPIQKEYKGYLIVIEPGVTTGMGAMELVSYDAIPNDDKWMVGKVEIRHETASGNLETIKTLEPKDYFSTAAEAKENAIKLAKEEIEKLIS